MNKTFSRISALLAALCLFLSGAAAAEQADRLPDVTLTDQFGNEHHLSDYQGKIVFLNFWATWCPPCVAEMPEFEELYHELGENREDVVILGVAAPDPSNKTEADEAGVAAFLEENGFTYPVLMDGDNVLWNAFPCDYVPHSHFFLRDGTSAEIELPASMRIGFGLPEGARDTIIIGGISRAEFEEALNQIR